jgi:hypothetical protein
MIEICLPLLELGLGRLGDCFLVLLLMSRIHVWWLQSVLPRDVPRQLHNKLDSVSFSDVLIEYDGGGHRVLSDGTCKVKVCRDTDFFGGAI